MVPSRQAEEEERKIVSADRARDASSNQSVAKAPEEDLL